MEVLYLLTSIINASFIKGLFISILSIMIAGKVLKTDIRNALAIIRVIILVYAGLNISYYFIAYYAPATMVSFGERATDSYWFAYYLMLVPNTLLPLLLLFKKLGRNKYVLLTLSLLMNLGWIFELFSIYSTDVHRYYSTTKSSFNFLWFIAIYGVFIGAVIYAIGRAIKPKMPENHTPIK